ncbi:flagellar hook-length control protein FliK, partial [Acinetobacter baumannii]
VLIAAREGGGQYPSGTAPLATTLSSDLQNGLQSHTIVKSLTIQLQPNDLGTLRADMRLSGDTMTLHIAASRAETAQMLAADKDK